MWSPVSEFFQIEACKPEPLRPYKAGPFASGGYSLSVICYTWLGLAWPSLAWPGLHSVRCILPVDAQIQQWQVVMGVSKPSQFCSLSHCRPMRSQATMPFCRLSFVWTDLDSSPALILETGPLMLREGSCL